MTTPETFYAVWCPERGQMTRQHDMHYAAQGEAERLARQHPGYRFYVMKATTLVQVETIKVVDLEEG